MTSADQHPDKHPANHHQPEGQAALARIGQGAQQTGQPTLFYSSGSPYARICRMALRERGLTGQVNEVETTLRDPEAVVLPFSPAGRVPALTLPNGPTITETTLVLGWLDRQIPSSTSASIPIPPVLPEDDQGIAQYGRALGLLDGIAVWNRELRRPVDERSPSVIALEQLRANRIADVLDADIRNGAYQEKAGNRVDAGYLTLAAVLGYAQRRHTVWDWRTGRAALVDWFERASRRPAFAQTLPPPSGI